MAIIDVDVLMRKFAGNHIVSNTKDESLFILNGAEESSVDFYKGVLVDSLKGANVMYNDLWDIFKREMRNCTFGKKISPILLDEKSEEYLLLTLYAVEIDYIQDPFDDINDNMANEVGRLIMLFLRKKGFNQGEAYTIYHKKDSAISQEEYSVEDAIDDIFDSGVFGTINQEMVKMSHDNDLGALSRVLVSKYNQGYKNVFGGKEQFIVFHPDERGITSRLSNETDRIGDEDTRSVSNYLNLFIFSLVEFVSNVYNDSKQDDSHEEILKKLRNKADNMPNTECISHLDESDKMSLRKCIIDFTERAKDDNSVDIYSLFGDLSFRFNHTFKGVNKLAHSAKDWIDLTYNTKSSCSACLRNDGSLSVFVANDEDLIRISEYHYSSQNLCRCLDLFLPKEDGVTYIDISLPSGSSLRVYNPMLSFVVDGLSILEDMVNTERKASYFEMYDSDLDADSPTLDGHFKMYFNYM